MKSDYDRLVDYMRAKRDKYRTERSICRDSDKSIEYKAKEDILNDVLLEATRIKQDKKDDSTKV